MPTRAIVTQFIKKVESELYDAVIAQFYALDASIRKNRGEPRQGRDVLIASEHR